MNPQDPLAALHPLREPAAIGWWPLAPGWWLVIALAVIAITILCYTLLKRYRRNAYRRLALQQLQTIRTRLSEATDDDERINTTLSGTNALLKSVALRVYPRHDIAALSGEAWLDFLNKTRQSTSSDTAFSSHFATAVYQPGRPELDTDQLLKAAGHWIARHRVLP